MKYPSPPDNSIESIRAAFQQMSDIVSKHVSGAVSTNKTTLALTPVSNATPISISPTPAPPAPGGRITLGDTFATNQPFKIVSGLAQKITSLDVGMPYVDGITLESGVALQSVSALSSQTTSSPTPLPPPGSDGDALYLGQSGTLTATMPSSLAGDVWYILVARRVTSTTILYTPEPPIKLA